MNIIAGLGIGLCINIGFFLFCWGMEKVFEWVTKDDND